MFELAVSQFTTSADVSLPHLWWKVAELRCCLSDQETLTSVCSLQGETHEQVHFALGFPQVSEGSRYKFFKCFMLRHIH